MIIPAAAALIFREARKQDPTIMTLFVYSDLTCFFFDQSGFISRLNKTTKRMSILIDKLVTECINEFSNKTTSVHFIWSRAIEDIDFLALTD